VDGGDSLQMWGEVAEKYTELTVTDSWQVKGSPAWQKMVA